MRIALTCSPLRASRAGPNLRRKAALTPATMTAHTAVAKMDFVRMFSPLLSNGLLLAPQKLVVETHIATWPKEAHPGASRCALGRIGVLNEAAREQDDTVYV